MARRLITLDDTADRLSVSTVTIRRWIAQGRLTGYRLGGRALRLDEAEVEKFGSPIPTAGPGQPAA